MCSKYGMASSLKPSFRKFRTLSLGKVSTSIRSSVKTWTQDVSPCCNWTLNILKHPFWKCIVRFVYLVTFIVSTDTLYYIYKREPSARPQGRSLGPKEKIQRWCWDCPHLCAGLEHIQKTDESNPIIRDTDHVTIFNFFYQHQKLHWSHWKSW